MSFGVELTVDNFAALYYTDNFHLSLKTAGLVAGLFGMMNLFARALGGIVSDRWNRRWGLRGRATLLGCTIAAEGLAMMVFAKMRALPLAIASMMLMGLFVKMSNGANYSIVPFINRRALGAVAGIVGAGGNAGAVLAGLLFKTASLTDSQAFLILGIVILLSAPAAFLVGWAFRPAVELPLDAGDAEYSGSAVRGRSPGRQAGSPAPLAEH
jgi:NNP family nitrate/nitrite transporter-like MFS transporter